MRKSKVRTRTQNKTSTSAKGTTPIMEKLTSTEKVIIDLVALRAWHFRASMDTGRDAKMRRWHRSQVEAISRKIPRRKPEAWSPFKLAMIEILADQYRKKLLHRSGALGPFNWKKFCAAAQASLRGEEP